MPLYAFEGRTPVVHETAFVAPSADLIGDVTVEAGASVWFNLDPPILDYRATPFGRAGGVTHARGAPVRPSRGCLAGTPDWCRSPRRSSVDPGPTPCSARTFSAIVVGEGANVQDGSVLHAAPGRPVLIGAGATVGHGCVVHACTVGEEALIANHATVLDGATIGARSLVAAGALVTADAAIPSGVLAIGTPARVMGSIEGTGAEAWVTGNPSIYQELARRYRAGFGDA